MPSMRQEALEYVRRGWYVFPCREKPSNSFIRDDKTVILPEKTPYTARGLNDASIDEDQVNMWWEKWQDALIGVNAGLSGLFVVDIDKKHVNGWDTYTQWDVNDSAGLHSTTPSGGMHVVFTGAGKSSTNAKTGVDTRGAGGYFIAPPSKILVGEYVGEYRREDDWSRLPGVIPDGLMTKLFPESTTEYVRGSNSLSDGQRKQLSRSTLMFLADGALQGERNSTLFKVLADFAGCGYSKEHARETVFPMCSKIGLSTIELDNVLNHAYSKPRTASIPDSIQEKIMEGGTKVTGKITVEEQFIMENALIGCLLIDNSLIPVIADILHATDFRAPKNKIIYRIITELYNSGNKVDAVTLSDGLSKASLKITIDDISNLAHEFYINAENAITYANIIREKASILKLEALMDNKDKYIQIGNLPEMVNSLEKDVADIAVYGGAKSTAILTAKQASDMVRDHTEKMAAGQIEQLKIGFIDYDKYVGGLYNNELVICAGRAGEGKSALALSILNYVALIQNKACALFSLEMSTHESVCRLICQLTGLGFRNVYQGDLDVDGWDKYMKAIDRISSSKLYFDDGFGMTIPEIRSKIRKLVEKDIKLIVIDQLEQIKGYEGMPPYVQFDRIAYDIKNLTQEFQIPIILNHQLNRNVTDRKLKNPEPQLADLNQAGEKPANQVWVISHLKDASTGDILKSKIKVLKNRNGARIEFAVRYVGERMLFANPTTEEESVVFHHKDASHDSGYDSASDMGIDD